MKRIFLVGAASVLLVVSPIVARDLATLPGTRGDLGSSTLAVPNPAAVKCLGLGGIVTAADVEFWGGSQIGLCRLHDDGVIDDWTLLRALNGSPGQAVRVFLNSWWAPTMAGSIETWAGEACETAGGEVVEYVEHLRASSVVRLCEFPDRSAIEIWTMFSGPGFYPELARAVSGAGETGPTFRPCPWPRTCMAPCQMDPPPQVLCRFTDGDLEKTSFACCCCGSGVNSFAPLPARR